MVILLLSLLNDHFFYSSNALRKSPIVAKVVTFVITVGFAYGISLIYSFKKNEQEIQVSFGKMLSEQLFVCMKFNFLSVMENFIKIIF